MTKGLRKKEFYFTSTDGTDRIHTVIWLPDQASFAAPKGIVQISHGMVEYVDRYDGLARSLNERGFVVTGNDHLGHGKSVRSREDWGYFTPADGSAYVVGDLHRLTRMIKKRFPGVPYYLLGHSMGSFLARRYAMTYGRELDGLILLGTGDQPRPLILWMLLNLRLLSVWKGERYRSVFLNRLIFGRYNRRVKNPRWTNDWVCSDENVMEAYNKDPACTFVFTINGIEVLMKSLLFIENKANIERIPKTLPILLASGREDPVGDYGKAVEKVRHIYTNAGVEDVSLRLFDGCRHELHNEVIREEIYAMIGDWLEDKNSKRGKERSNDYVV